LLRISDAVVIAAVATSGAASAFVDLRSRRVPNALTVGIAVVGLALSAAHVSDVSLLAALGGLAIGCALMLPGHVLGGMGAGDVKLFAALGTMLGPTRIVMAFLYTAIAGGILAVSVARRRRTLGATLERTAVLVRTGGANVADIERPSLDNRFAYAPAIALGALAAAIGF
jgi:prepilin peptidase CpaA